MANVFDVAKYILEKCGSMTTMKLQKLAYYSQAWSLVWDERPIFGERIEAWANGPVTPQLYELHRGRFEIDAAALTRGASSNLDETARATIDTVLGAYGDLTGATLSEMTHSEPPWLDARSGLQPGVRSNAEITHAAMAEYYGSLY